MKMLLDIDIASPAIKIDYQDKIMLTGSCFTEHIGNSLIDLKFQAMQNPHGIIFDPSSLGSSLISYIENRQYSGNDLIYLNELWQSWQHHTRFSGMDRQGVLETINQSQQIAHTFIKEAKWLVITLGTSFSYRLADNGQPVANCHRAPATLFQKHLMTVDEIQVALDTCMYRLFQFNPGVQVIFTVSPVRHIRDGVIENNRSKARLIEATHHIVNKFRNLHYFPSYELVIDVLRDYRFFDVDLVHPNYQATQYVIENFMAHFINDDSRTISREVQRLVIARKHKAANATTQAHMQFLRLQAERTRALMEKYPYLHLHKELEYFETGD